jgi:hypothetical protein
MKRLFIVIFQIIIGLSVYAQTPQGINYQTVVRDAGGNILDSKNVGIRINIRSGSSVGTTVYAETHARPTNKFGLINLVIGQGTPVSGTFNTINWGNSTYFAEILVDINGGTSYISIGTQQLMSVPYALYAASGGTTYQAGNGISITGNTISNSSPSIAYQSGTGIAISGNTISNTAPGVTYTAGTGISINNNIITNSSPNQTVNITGSNGVNVTGTYPNFAISSSSSSGGQIIVLNSANAATLTLTAPSIVQVDGTITISADNSRLTTSNNNQIFGGTFQGNGSPVLYSSTNNKFYGVTFNNISVDVKTSSGSTELQTNTIFENCTFTGTINRLPSQALFVNCTFTNATIGDANYLGRFIKCKITNSTIPLLIGISQSNITSSIIGTKQIGYLTDNVISTGNQIYLLDDCRVMGNHIANSKLLIGGSGINSNTPRTLSISNNFFDYGDAGFTDAMINIDLSSGIRAKSYVISNNQFLITNSSLNLTAIKIQNNDGSTLLDSKILISGNLFNRSTLAAIVNNSTNARLIVVNNITNSVSLGVTDNGNLVRLVNNFNF